MGMNLVYPIYKGKQSFVSKQKFQTKKQARRALLYAIRDPKRFRSSIRACHDEGVKVFVIPVTSSIEEVEGLERRVKIRSM